MARPGEKLGARGELDDASEYMTAMRSAMRSTAARSWLMKSMARPSRARRSRSSSSSCAWTETSRAESGSSATSSLGSSTKARAMAMRWRWPPENRGVALEIARREAEARELLCRPRAALARPADAVDDERLGHDAADPEARIERAEGILEDELDRAPMGLEGAPRECRELDATKAHAAAIGAVEEACRARERGLAAARLADEGEGLAWLDREARVHERRDPAPATRREMLGETRDCEEGLAHRPTLKQATLRPGATFLERRLGLPARSVGERATVGEAAAGRQPHGRGHLARNAAGTTGALNAAGTARGAAPACGATTDARHARDEGAAIGMKGLGEERVRRSMLDEAARIHHTDLVRHFGDHRHVVADELDRHAEPALRLEHELEDLRLDGDVEGGRRLVGHEEVGLAGERHCDHGALAHPARELVGVVARAQGGGRDADAGQGRDRFRTGFAVRQPTMEAQRLGDLLADGEDRVEGGHRLLKDDGDAIAAQGRELGFAEGSQLDAVEPDRTVQDAAGRGDEVEQRKCQDRLARSALAHDAEGAAAREPVGDAVEGHKRARARGEGDGELLDREERCAFRLRSLPCAQCSHACLATVGPSRRDPSGRSSG